MFLYLFTTILALGSVMSRDATKSARSALPIISHSLVNLGKMDISFHFDAKDIPQLRTEPASYSSSLFFKPEPVVDEPCACSSLRNFKEPLIGSPSDIINKIIRSNELFSFNKDLVTSPTCCESHENAHEDIITFDLNPKPVNPNTRNSFFPFPLMFENLTPQKTYSASSMPLKPKAIDIFVFPKKNHMELSDFGRFPAKKDSIQIVGDKDLKNNLSNLKLRPIVRPITSTVKKDLTNEDINKTEDKKDTKVTTTVIVNNPNAL